jgi:hypothetical protein
VHRWEQATRIVHCPANCGEQLELSPRVGIDIATNADQSWTAKQAIECPGCHVRFRVERCVVYPMTQADLSQLFQKGKASHATR